MKHLDSAYWRRLAWLGATRGPSFWLRLSPSPIGLIAAVVLPGQRAHVRGNLRALLGRRSAIAEHVDVARTFMHFAQSLAESLSLQGTSNRTPSIHVLGESHLRRALAEGRGVILGTAHTPGWEAALLALERVSDADVLVAMRREREDAARDFHPTSVVSPTRHVVSVGDDPLSSLTLLQHLRSGGVVAMQMDRCPAGMRSIEVQAGRKTWWLPAGPFALAAASGAPIVLVLTSRSGFLSYDLRVCRKVGVDRHAGAGQVRAAEKVARELARHVYAAPTQWFDFQPA